MKYRLASSRVKDRHRTPRPKAKIAAIGLVSLAAVFLAVTQRSPALLGERCVTSKERLRGRLQLDRQNVEISRTGERYDVTIVPD